MVSRVVQAEARLWAKSESKLGEPRKCSRGQGAVAR